MKQIKLTDFGSSYTASLAQNANLWVINVTSKLASHPYYTNTHNLFDSS